MKKVFICAPNRYKERTKKLASRLEEFGFQVRFAAENTDQTLKNKEISDSNLKLIKESDFFIAYFVNDGHYGIDFATEVGKVSGMDRIVIGFVEVSKEKLEEFKKNLEKDIMFTNSINLFAWSFGELRDMLK